MVCLRELGEASKLSLDIVFQSLMQALADSGRAPSLGADFDSQGGTFGTPGAADFVPMHQAKVLDRSERLKENDASIRALAGSRLDWLVDSADLLRKLLRVKVEDGNDVHSAAGPEPRTLDLPSHAICMESDIFAPSPQLWPRGSS